MDICKDGQASQGDGKKRRSFLPAPKKSFGAPQMSGQVSPNTGPFQDQSPTLPMPPPEVSLWNYQNLSQSYPAGPEAREQQRTPSNRSRQSERHRSHKRTDEQAFGVGLRIGARIMIGGIKPGILRYLGTTHFAHGIFCGIELCDPDGNHDGKVQGHRYFVCAPNHGIFAPKEKVCLDMSSSLERLSASSDFIYSSLDSLNESLSRASRNYGDKELVTKDIHGRGSTGAKYAEYVSYLRNSGESRAPAHGEGAVQTPRLQVTEEEWLEFQKYKEQCQMENEQRMLRAARSHGAIEPPHFNHPDYLPPVVKNNKDVFLSQDGSSRRYHVGTTTSSDRNSGNSSSSGWELGRASPSRGGRDPRSSEDDGDEEEGYTRDTLSADVKDQLRADSRHYLNFTFDRDSPNQSFDPDDSGSDWDKESRKNAANLCGVGSASGDANPATCSPARHLATQPPYSRTDSGKQDTHAVDSQYVDGSLQQRVATRSSLELGRGNLPPMGDGQELSQGGYTVKYGGGGSIVLSITQFSDSPKSDKLTSPKNRSGVVAPPHRYVPGMRDGYENVRDPRKINNNGTSPRFDISASTKLKRNCTTPPNNSANGRASNSTDYKVNVIEELKNKVRDDDSVNASPEVSQTLEWYYEQGLDERIAQDRQDSVMTSSTSTGTSESTSDALRDISDQLDIEGATSRDELDPFEVPDNEYESIDYLEDIRGFGKDSRTAMTDSGISDRDYDLYPSSSTEWRNLSKKRFIEDDAVSQATVRTLSSTSSQETLVADYASPTSRYAEGRNFELEFANTEKDTKKGIPGKDITCNLLDARVHVASPSRPGKSPRRVTATSSPVIEAEEYRSEGRVLSKNERPLSLLSTTSGDTGYGPDTDSELGTLTTNTPSTDGADKVVAEMDHNSRKNVTGTGPSPGSQHAPKTRDEDDHSTDLTANTEDERAEADQIFGRSSKALSSSSQNNAVSKDRANETNNKDNAATTQKDPGTHQSGSTDSIVDSPTKEDDNQEERDLEEPEQQNAMKSRKSMVIRKKRSDNIDHKMPNINVTSRLADYIKTPVPIKSKEDKEKEQKKKVNKNVKNVSHKRLSITETSYTKQDISRSPSVDKDLVKEEPEKPKQIIKRAPPKSKWGDIMSQIESNKDTAKPKMLSEVKSPLAAYLSAPPPQQAAEGEGVNRREFKSKIKQLPPPPPKIDFSKVKSKLNVPTAASAMKALPKHELPSHTQKLKSDDGASPEDGELIIHENGEDVIVDSEGGGAVSATGSRAGFGQKKDSSEDSHLKGEPVDQSRKHDRRPSAVSVKTDHSETRTAQAQSNKSVKSQKKAALPPANQARKPQAAAAGKPTANIISNVSSIRGNINFATRSALKEEVERLESLCEARIEELVTTKLELESMTQAFDALAVVVNYCSFELKAFECPDFEKKLETTSRKLEECLSQIADLSAQNEHLVTSLDQVTLDRDQETRQKREILESSEREIAELVKTVEDLNNTHNTALSSQREEMSATHDEAMKKFGQFHEIQIQLLSQTHDRQVADMTNENKLEVNQLKICHLEETQELRNKHDKQIEEIHQQHRNKLDDMTNRYETIKISLLEKVESLRKECEELAMRARNSEEALRRDSDVKVQMALAPYLTLPDEIQSLKAVQEMRLEEIQKLRTKNMDLEKQLEEIFIAREKIISLQQKVESLGAIINIKTEHEKQLHEKCLVLIRKYDHQARANKRISMDYEQVMWKMSQSLELGSSESLSRQDSAHSNSGSPSHGMSPRGSRVDMRHGSGHFVSEGERKLRPRSAVLFTEKDSNDSHLPTPSPRLKHKRWRKKSETDEVGSERREVTNRMCQSAGAELMSDDPNQEIIWDDSNVSIMLMDLTTSQIESGPDLARSYARSLSGVTDSGVYDSLTRSDVLDTSMVSTDSGWVASQHFTTKRDSTVSECESGPAAGDYNMSTDTREAKFKILPA